MTEHACLAAIQGGVHVAIFSRVSPEVVLWGLTVDGAQRTWSFGLFPVVSKAVWPTGGTGSMLPC